jgi:hypothetical protein
MWQPSYKDIAPQNLSATHHSTPDVPFLHHHRNPMIEHNSRCLSIKCDDEEQEQTTFHVYLKEDQSPYWKALQRTPSLHSVMVHAKPGNSLSRTGNVVSEIALAINIRNGGVKKIWFDQCWIEDLCKLWFAIAKISRDHQIAFHFVDCRIDVVAAEDLQLMLQRDIVEELSMINCSLNSAEGTMIAAGIRVNRSLRKFECYYNVMNPLRETQNIIMMGVSDSLKINQKLVRLGLTIDTDSTSLWEVFQSTKDSQTLQSIEIRESWELSEDSMKAISLLCFTIKLLQELIFRRCSFHHGAMKFLIEALSNKKLVNTLTLEQVTICDSNHANDQPMTMSCGTVQVEKLNISGTRFKYESLLLQTMTDIANKGCVQTLHLGEVTYSKHRHNMVIGYMCDVFLRPNRGPSELIIDEVLNSETTTMLTAALQQNISVRALEIPYMYMCHRITFAQGLANMGGLRQLSIRVSGNDAYSEQVLEALQQSLEQNTSLCKLSIDGFHSICTMAVKRYLDRIHYLLTTNLVGRHTLMAAPNVPVGLWAQVLARSTNEVDGIYFALTAKPDIVMQASIV